MDDRITGSWRANYGNDPQAIAQDTAMCVDPLFAGLTL